MKPFYLTLSILAFLSMAVLALALLGNRIDLLPAATAGTALFVALMWASGRIEQELAALE